MPALTPVVNKLINRIEKATCQTLLRSKPVVVDVVLTKACNFACSFCKDYETDGAQRISIDNFERMAAQLMPTASRMNICSGGEPYLHTGLEEILAIGRKYNPSLHTWLLSNGSILRELRLKRIIEQELVTQHGFSVDGYKAATVELIRINADLPTIHNNIGMLIRLRDIAGKRYPTITIRYALMRRNIEELPDAIQFWGKMGINALDTGYLSLANGMDLQESRYYHPDLTERVFAEARKVAQHFPQLCVNLPETIKEQEKYRSAPKTCKAPWEFVKIDTNGEVLPCYRAFEALRFDSVYGDNAVSFEEIWNSPRYQALRKTVNNDRAEKMYEYCGYCEYRYGWSDERAHFGDLTWVYAIGEKWLKSAVDHRRPLKGAAAKVEAERAPR